MLVDAAGVGASPAMVVDAAGVGASTTMLLDAAGVGASPTMLVDAAGVGASPTMLVDAAEWVLLLPCWQMLQEWELYQCVSLCATCTSAILRW